MKVPLRCFYCNTFFYSQNYAATVKERCVEHAGRPVWCFETRVGSFPVDVFLLMITVLEIKLFICLFREKNS